MPWSDWFLDDDERHERDLEDAYEDGFEAAEDDERKEELQQAFEDGYRDGKRG